MGAGSGCWLLLWPACATPLGCKDEESLGNSASVYWEAVPLNPPEHRRLPWRTQGLLWSASQTHRTGNTHPPPGESLYTWPWPAPPYRSGGGDARALALCWFPAQGQAGVGADSGGPACTL